MLADAALQPTVSLLQASAHELYLSMINAELREIDEPVLNTASGSDLNEGATE